MFVLTTLTTVALQQMFGGQFSVLEEVAQTVFSPRVPLPLFHLVLLPGLASCRSSRLREMARGSALTNGLC